MIHMSTATRKTVHARTETEPGLRKVMRAGGNPLIRKGPLADRTVRELLAILQKPKEKSTFEMSESGRRVVEMRNKYPGNYYEVWYARHPEGKKAAKELAQRELTTEQFGDVVMVMKLGESAVEREMATFALGEMGDRGAVPELCETLLNDESLVVRREAAIALGKIGDVKAAAALTASMKRAARNDGKRLDALEKAKQGIEEAEKELEDLGKEMRTIGHRIRHLQREMRE
ncbi:TPA: HEAT repeat domain-containing protein, partial [Candidatus Micrarchaeota archaeon]|nr:HEAT repeat domain-containing protein [Candidatus Micrarchaeota archaeon]